MANENIFLNENVKLRIINLEYKYKQRFSSTNISELKKAKADFEADVRRIYKEETHLDLSQDIEIYTSKELLQQNKDNSIKHSGYDGTAIYIRIKNSILINFRLSQRAVLIMRIGHTISLGCSSVLIAVNIEQQENLRRHLRKKQGILKSYIPMQWDILSLIITK